MNCIVIEKEHRDSSDAFVKTATGGTLFHTTTWLDSLELPYRIFACTSGGRIVAVMPIVEQRRFGTITAVQPALTPYLGIAGNDISAKPVTRISQWKEITTAFVETLQQRYSAIEMNLTPEWVDIHGFMWGGFSSQVRYTYTVDLSSLDVVWNDMDAKRRNDIRRAEKEGVTVEESSDFDAVLQNVQKTFRRQEMKPRFLDTAKRIHAALAAQKRCSAWLAREPGRGGIVAAVYLVWDDRRAYYLLGGYDGRNAHGGAHALAIWTAMQSMAARGWREFDFEGSDVPQIEHYFRKFGGRLTPYYTVRWESPVFRVATALKSAASVPRRALRRIVRR